MTIRDIIRGGRGQTHGWRVERRGDIAILVHYSTAMLRWDVRAPATSYTVLSIGHGSVSDQNGVNTFFRLFDVPCRFDRDQRGGGPRVTSLEVA